VSVYACACIQKSMSAYGTHLLKDEHVVRFVVPKNLGPLHDLTRALHTCEGARERCEWVLKGGAFARLIRGLLLNAPVFQADNIARNPLGGIHHYSRFLQHSSSTRMKVSLRHPDFLHSQKHTKYFIIFRSFRDLHQKSMC